MGITTQLIQRALSKFGYKLVRTNNTSNSQPSPAPSDQVYGLNNCLSVLKRFNFNPKHIIDVGANRGFWTRDVVQFFPDAHYTLVEPQNDLKAYMGSN